MPASPPDSREKTDFFGLIGRFAARFRWAILAFWAIALALTLFFAPSLSSVSVADQSSYLPANALSYQAAALAAKYFPEQISSAQAVLVIQSPRKFTADRKATAYLRELTLWLEDKSSPIPVSKLLSPTDPNYASRLISRDGKLAMFFVNLKGPSESPPMDAAFRALRARLQNAPKGLRGYVTGSTAIVKEYKSEAMSSAGRTTLITVLLVISVLLAVFRSPVLPLVPLGTIAVSFLIARGLIAWISRLGMTISSFTEVFLVVLLFGAGTDYCLFLTSRFREFMADGMPGPEAAGLTVSRMGETITSSAGTVIVGLVGMSFARMKLFTDTGPSLALGVGLTLLAGLTLTPALLAVLGRHAFWPGVARHAKIDGFWSRLAAQIGRRPWLPLLLALAILVPLAIYGQGQKRDFDLLADLSDRVPSKAGFNLLAKHFGSGEVQPLDVIVTRIPNGAGSSEGLAYLGNLTRRLAATPGVAEVRSLTQPFGNSGNAINQPLLVSNQLAAMASLVDTLIASEAGTAAPKASASLVPSANSLNQAETYLTELSGAFPDLKTLPAYDQASIALSRLRQDLHEALSISGQLMLVADGVREAGAELRRGSPGNPSRIGQMRAELASLDSYLRELAGHYPALPGLSGYRPARTALRSLQRTLGALEQDLQVSTQLHRLSDILANLGTGLKPGAMKADPDSWAGGTGLEASLNAPGAYLEELGRAYPAIASQRNHREAAKRLREATTLAAGLQGDLLVGRQLEKITELLDTLAQAVAVNPLALLAPPGKPSLREKLDSLSAYLSGLSGAFPTLGQMKEMATIREIARRIDGMLAASDLGRWAEMGPRIHPELTAYAKALAGLTELVRRQMPEATYLPKDLSDLGGVGSDQTVLTKLAAVFTAAASNLADLAGSVQDQYPEALFIPHVTLPVSASPDRLPALAADLATLESGLTDLARAVPTVLPAATFIPADLQTFAAARTALTGVIPQARSFAVSLRDLAAHFSTGRPAYFLPSATAAGDLPLGLLLSTYAGNDGRAARFQVILSDEPFSEKAFATVERLRAYGAVSGGSAVLLDLRDVMETDFTRVMILVLAGILIVLIWLLRSLVAPIYMLATILLSYGATLGFTRLLFGAILHRDLTWWVPFFMFILLVALGMDYNIFLMGRVKEEIAGTTTRLGVERALERSGNIITSAGIIMAGTFAAMLSASLLGLVQLSFAVAIGVLLDTFIIRTAIMPAIILLLGRWNWWPGRTPVS